MNALVEEPMTLHLTLRVQAEGLVRVLEVAGGVDVPERLPSLPGAAGALRTGSGAL